VKFDYIIIIISPYYCRYLLIMREADIKEEEEIKEHLWGAYFVFII
jgi:hypothetical protein